MLMLNEHVVNIAKYVYEISDIRQEHCYKIFYSNTFTCKCFHFKSIHYTPFIHLFSLLCTHRNQVKHIHLMNMYITQPASLHFNLYSFLSNLCLFVFLFYISVAMIK